MSTAGALGIRITCLHWSEGAWETVGPPTWMPPNDMSEQSLLRQTPTECLENARTLHWRGSRLTIKGRHPIRERHVRPIAAQP